MPNTFVKLNRCDNENRKFQADSGGNVAVNVLDTAGKIGDTTLLISLGLIAGMEQRNKSAFNLEVDTSTSEDIRPNVMASRFNSAKNFLAILTEFWFEHVLFEVRTLVSDDLLHFLFLIRISDSLRIFTKSRRVLIL